MQVHMTPVGRGRLKYPDYVQAPSIPTNVNVETSEIWGEGAMLWALQVTLPGIECSAQLLVRSSNLSRATVPKSTIIKRQMIFQYR